MNVSGFPQPMIIGHRGASGYLPEHTLPAYQKAIDQGVDFIEPDVVSTKDGILVARHETNLADSTDVSVHPEFSDRRTTKYIDGQDVSGWFTEDFTLAEIKTLRARGRNRLSQTYNDQFEIPTLAEVLSLAKGQERKIGVYPETKHPSHFDSIGLSLEEPLLVELSEAGFGKDKNPVIIQSFETQNLKDLDHMTDIPLAQLIESEGSPTDLLVSGDPRTYDDLLTPEGLAEISEYADLLSVSKDRILPRGMNDSLGSEPTGLIQNAHDAGLGVHVYTFRAENEALPKELRHEDSADGLGDLTSEVRAFLRAGVDGIFANHPDLAIAALPPE